MLYKTLSRHPVLTSTVTRCAFINQPATIWLFLPLQLSVISRAFHAIHNWNSYGLFHASQEAKHFFQDQPTCVHFYLSSWSADKAFPMHTNPVRPGMSRDQIMSTHVDGLKAHCK